MKINAAFSGYTSNDIDACRTFYGDILGLEVSEQMGGLELVVGGQRVFIYPKSEHQPAAYTVLNFVVDAIDPSVDDLVNKGVVFERYESLPAAQDEKGILRGKDAGEGYGPNIAWFKDPSGNVLALVEE